MSSPDSRAEKREPIVVETKSVPEIIAELPSLKAVAILNNIYNAESLFYRDEKSWRIYSADMPRFDDEVRDLFPRFSDRIKALERLTQDHLNIKPELSLALIYVVRRDMEAVVGYKFDERALNHLRRLLNRTDVGDTSQASDEASLLTLGEAVRAIECATPEFVRQNPGLYRGLFKLFGGDDGGEYEEV